MNAFVAPRVALIPLDAEMVRLRLDREEFELEREVMGTRRTVRFGPEFPGDALVLYPRFLEVAGAAGVVEGTFVVVDGAVEGAEVVGQLGTMGPPAGTQVEIGYGMNASARGRGLATAAVAALVALLEASTAVGRVTARTAVTNPASGRVLEKNGFEVIDREDGDEGELLVWEHRGRSAPA